MKTPFIFIAEIRPCALVCPHLVIIAPKKKAASCRQSTQMISALDFHENSPYLLFLFFFFFAGLSNLALDNFASAKTEN